MPSPRHEITATFVEEKFVFLNDGGTTRVVIGDVELPGRELLTVKGEADEGRLVPGLPYRFYGRTVNHHKHGKQFTFTSFVQEEPASQAAIVTYLQQCYGIGRIVASRIYDFYRDRAVEKLRTEPLAVCESVKGLNAEKAKAASEFLRQHQATERAKMDVMELLNGRGFPRKTLDRVLRDFGSAAADRIRQNPYLLMRYQGCGFQTTDSLWIELGKPAGRLKRQALCAWHAVDRSRGGDTWVSVNHVRDHLAQSIAGAELRFHDAVELSTRGKLLELRHESGSGWVAESRKAANERRVAEIVAGVMCEDVPSSWPSVKSLGNAEISHHQLETLKAVLQSRFGILAGRPGTGKTHCSSELVKLLRADGWRQDDIAVCAPTGKAAVRITEAMRNAGLELQATTIHSLLKVMSADGGWFFEHGELNPLPHAFVLLDEASMLDCDLAASLFSAIGPQTHLLIVGDTNQLPPVGHGAPLRDLIAAGLPSGELTEIRRNSGRIVQVCSEIVDKKSFVPSAKVDLSDGENLLHLEVAEAEQQIETLEKLFAEFTRGNEYDEVWDVQVLVAVNAKSPLGRKDLNRRLQQLLNARGQSDSGNPFRVRDKIINTKNGWFPSACPETDPVNAEGKCYVANGEQAEVAKVEPLRTIAKLSMPERTIIIPRGNASEDDGDSVGDDSEELKADTGCAWELGYAISGHKSQGSEWPVVIMLADEHNSARMVQSRNWIYTAISRAKKLCITLGRRSVIRDMLYRDGLRRKTFLAETITAEVAAIERRQVAGNVAAWNEQAWEEIGVGVFV